MKLINKTPYPAILFSAVLEEESIGASVIARVTFDVHQGIATPAAKQVWAPSLQPFQSEYGLLEGDGVLHRGGVDILVFGSAKAPSGNPVKQMAVNVYFENQRIHSIQVFGNRFWKKNLFGFSITEPEPFTEIPLTLDNAYGGQDEWDGLRFPYANNGAGKGFIWEKENVPGKPLPNLEDPSNLITKWDQRPDPAGVGMCPLNSARVMANVKVENGKLAHVSPRLFNVAFPPMVLDSVSPGQEIRVEGVTLNGDFRFKIPSISLGPNISVGDENWNDQLKIEQIGLIPDKQQAFLTLRYTYQYDVIPFEKRFCELNELKNQ